MSSPAAGKTAQQGNPASPEAQNKSSYEAQAEANSDKQRCSTAQNKAMSSCGGQSQSARLQKPAQNGSDEENKASMAEYCRQLNAANSNNASANQAAGQTCYSGYSSCKDTCQELVDKYTPLAACENCEAKSIFQQTLSDLKNRVSSCENLSSKVSEMGSQGLASGANAGDAAACQSMSSAMPSSMGAGAGGAGSGGGQASNAMDSANPTNANDPYGCGSDPSSAACQSCSSNPNSSACQSLAGKESYGQAAFATGDASDKKSKSNFDVQDTSGYDVSPGLNAGTASANAGGAKNGTIANNSGGGIPGGGGGSPASLGGGGKPGRASPGSPGYTTDVMQGFQSGGYSSDVSPNRATGEDGLMPTSFGNGRGPASNSQAQDLKRFLPGGDKDPMRRGVGGRGRHPEINSQFVNMWDRISERMEEKCRLGVLLGCG